MLGSSGIMIILFGLQIVMLFLLSMDISIFSTIYSNINRGKYLFCKLEVLNRMYMLKICDHFIFAYPLSRNNKPSPPSYPKPTRRSMLSAGSSQY